MTPLDFIAAVLPSPGNGRYCVVELTSKKKEHVYVERLEETEEVTSAWLNSSNDIYFALSTFREKGRRTADNAQSIRTVAIDMDGYAQHAVEIALEDFNILTFLADHDAGPCREDGDACGLGWPLDQHAAD